MLEKRFQIYGLFDPNGELRYIGQTIQELNDRLKGHIDYSKRLNKNNELYYSDTYICNWIRSLLKDNIKPTIRLIQNLYSKEDLDNAEIYWIKFFREQGCRLVNTANGGNGVGKHSEESKKKISLGHKGKKMSERTKQKMLQTRKEKGCRPSEETKDKISLSLLGHVVSDEVRLKISLGHKGKVLSEETRLLISKIRGGRPFKDQYGNIYQTIREAARKLNLHYQNISSVLHRKHKQIKGYTFNYLEEIN